MSKQNKIAIVGISCRFPGNIHNLEDYWQILKQGQDVVTEVPDIRWNKEIYGHPSRKMPGSSYTWSAGTLAKIDEFDAEFFGISRREAEQMDPQQRLLLELTWEAFEDAGFPANKLKGSDCGVFIGIGSNDYSQRKVDDLGSMDAYSMTGNTASIGSNRLSYIFDLKGPSMSIDTACSSSLVALHQACISLRTGETSLAITGGVNMLLHPLAFVGFSKASMLSPDGRCKAFDAAGNGYVRSEGAAIVVLKLLSQAEKDGDHIHAVILDSGVNSDGKTNGITVPSSDAQAQLLKQMYQNSQVNLDDISYLEAHGTGTAVGDPLESKALSDAIAKARRADNPLLIGSAKTNLGHLEVASGMVGLLKIVLALKNHAIPANLHFKTPNPNIDFETLNLKVVDKFTPIAELKQPLLMGVNSFGFGGANAHVLLEEYQAPECISKHKFTATPPLFLSAKKDEALKQLAKDYADLIKQHSSQEYYDIAWSAVHHRQSLTNKVAFFADNKEGLIQSLQDFYTEKATENFIEVEQLTQDSEVALVYSGNGSQWIGMGCVLYKENQHFRRVLKEIDLYWLEYADFSIIDELFAPKDNARMHLTEVAQPTLFAVQVGITRMLQNLGLKACAAFGHSVGEIAAAWACGILTLKQAVLVIYERSFAQALTQGQGKMAAVGLDADTMHTLINALNLTGKLVIAGINSPKSITLSGQESALDSIEEYCVEENIFFKLLDLDYAFHSPYMNPIQERVLESLQGLQATTEMQTMTFVSTVTGTELDGAQLNAEYWWQNIREPVEFSKAVDTLIAKDVRVFLEIGSHPVLGRYLEQCLEAQSQDGRVISTLKRDEESVAKIIAAAYQGYLFGADFNTDIIFPRTGNLVQLPTYPWQREKYWSQLSPQGYGLIERKIDNPLLGYRLKEAEASWENNLDSVKMAWLADHEVGGAIVLPAAAYVEMALAAAKMWFKHEVPAFELEELDINAPIVLEAEHAKTIVFNLSPVDATFSIRSRDYLTNNISGRLLGLALQQPQRMVAIVPALMDAPQRLSGAEHYQLTKTVGLNYGPAFQGVENVWLWAQQRIAWAKLSLPKSLHAESKRYLLHPALLDSCFQLLVDIFSTEIKQRIHNAMIPVRVEKLRFYGQHGTPTWCKVTLKRHNPRSVVADFMLLDAEHNIVALLDNVRFKQVNFMRAADHLPATYLYKPKLMPVLNPAQAAPIPESKILAATVIATLKSQEEILKRARHFNEVLPLFDLLVNAYCWEAVATLMGNKTWASVNDLVTTNDITEAQINLLSKILMLLREDNLAIYEFEQWQLLKDEEMPSAEIIWRTILADYCEYLPELVLMSQCGSNLVEVLRGNIEPVELLNPAKSSIQEHLYAQSSSFGVANLAVVATVQEIVQQWPQNRRLRILEVAGGNIELMQLLLQTLPQEGCDYVFVDANEDVIAHAQALFEDFEDLTCQQWDLEKRQTKLPSCLELASFDVIIVANVIHKTEHLESIFSHLRQFLVTAGLLILQERADNRFTDITAGLEPNWWLYDEQTGVTVSRLLTPDAWKHLLEEQGFVKTKAIIEPEAIDYSGVFVVLAHNSSVHIEVDFSQQQLTKCLVLIDSQQNNVPLFKQLKQQLKARSVQVVGAYLGEITETVAEGLYCLNSRDFKQFLAPSNNYQQIVYLSTNVASEHNTDACAQQCFEFCQILQLVNEQKLTVHLVTRGAGVYDQRENDDNINPQAAAIWGVGRVAMNEYPNLNIHLVDIPIKASNSVAAELLDTEFFHPTAETEVVITQTGRHVMRMQTFNLHEQTQPQSQSNMPISLDFKVAGSLNNLYWRGLEAAPSLDPEHIQIRPLATGLNFRDVMYAMGMLSDEAVEHGFAGATLGMELSGVVERVGKQVKNFRVGDEVISFAPASFSTRVITATTATAHKPKSWSHAQAATIPTTFFTVYYSLYHLARLQPNERILIHGAAGGVGLAAIQYAESIGAEIFATAGTDEKRTFVKMMGADHVMDSRSMNFADQIMEITDGQGVDVILNSLSGEAIWRNLAILRPFGRFLELGKRDFYENSKIGLRPFRNNISYYGIDADQLLIERTVLANSLFKDMMKLFDEGILKPLPFRVFPASQIVDAFRYMQQSRQIGKVVVSFDNIQGLKSHKITAPTPLKLDQHASYLVTGGLGGFGLKTAQWLVKKGAKHLILISRSGVQTPEAEIAVRAMEEDGVTVYAHAVDVTDSVQMQALFSQLAYCAPTLKGVIHSAAIIEDALIKDLDADKLQQVMQPKIAGAWNLHRLTKKLSLDFFVMYSSMTTFLGNPGQANYVAANSYLESLAHYRRQQNLPGLYVAWSAIDDAGFLTRNQDIKDALEARIGSKAIKSEVALIMLEKLLQSELTGAAVIDFDWKTIQRFMPAAKSPKYEQTLLHAQRLGSEGDQHEDIKVLLADLSAEEAMNFIAQLLSQEVGKILRLPADKVDKKKSVFDLGMDSLMGMELAIAIEDRFEVKLPLMTLAEGATITKIADKISGMLLNDELIDDPQQDALKALYNRHEGKVSTEQDNQLIDAIQSSNGEGTNA